MGKYLQHHVVPSCPQAAILQQTAEYIFSLEQEKTRLLQQNTQLKRFIQVPAGASFSQHPPPGSLTPAWAGLDPTTGLGCRWSRRSHLVHRPAYFTACLPARASVSPLCVVEWTLEGPRDCYPSWHLASLLDLQNGPPRWVHLCWAAPRGLPWSPPPWSC